MSDMVFELDSTTSALKITLGDLLVFINLGGLSLGFFISWMILIISLFIIFIIIKLTKDRRQDIPQFDLEPFPSLDLALKKLKPSIILQSGLCFLLLDESISQ